LVPKIQGVPTNFDIVDALFAAPQKNGEDCTLLSRSICSMGIVLLIFEWYAKSAFTKNCFQLQSLLHSKTNVQTTRLNFERCKFSLPNFLKHHARKKFTRENEEKHQTTCLQLLVRFQNLIETNVNLRI
jgi:hypothetical protein